MLLWQQVVCPNYRLLGPRRCTMASDVLLQHQLLEGVEADLRHQLYEGVDKAVKVVL